MSNKRTCDTKIKNNLSHSASKASKMLRNRKGNKIAIIDTLEPIVPTAEIRYKAKFSLEVNFGKYTSC